MTFDELYKSYYLPYCSKNGVPAVNISQFYKIRLFFSNSLLRINFFIVTFLFTRRSERRNYKRSKTIRKGGYNHVCCGDCSRLRRLIVTNKNNPIERDKFQNEFLAHVEKQQIYRDIYEYVIIKSVSRKHGKYCISMIIDAAGGGRFYPRFKTMEKSEAQRHELLKTKMTFAVVHGVGTFMYQSFPDLGCQGCNLTLEVCFRGVLSFIITHELVYSFTVVVDTIFL